MDELLPMNLAMSVDPFAGMAVSDAGAASAYERPLGSPPASVPNPNQTGFGGAPLRAGQDLLS